MAAAKPARLGFLAIYNPSLAGEDGGHQQIVYWFGGEAAVSTPTRQAPTPTQRDERLRQVGLARALVEFAGGFAGGRAVDGVDTARARMVVRELEPGWWVVAELQLARLAGPPPPLLPDAAAPAVPTVDGRADAPAEYSARDLKPAFLVARELDRAHAVWRLHHGPSLTAAGMSRTGGARLTRYWDLFLATWPVVLRGNPARDALGAINLAAGGELGIGVGEEHRGSGEREVLEGLVRRVDGLVDLVVSRFGVGTGDATPWLGTGRPPAADDGAVFLGVGAVARPCLRNVVQWMEDLYTWGENAYGVVEGPAAQRGRQTPPTPDPPRPADGEAAGLVSYLTLGLGTRWARAAFTASLPFTSPSRPSDTTTPPDTVEDAGRFLIGLRGQLEESVADTDGDNGGGVPVTQVTQRSVHVALRGGTTTTKLRVVVYAARPFVFALLFQARTAGLGHEGVYRSLHHLLWPLRRPMVASTGAGAGADAGADSVYELAWRPDELVARCGLPNIPAYGAGRGEAMGTHGHVVALVAGTREPTHGQVERTCRTSRGWWIVWRREPEQEDGRGRSGGEMIVVRRARERNSVVGGNVEIERSLALPGATEADAHQHIDTILGQVNL